MPTERELAKLQEQRAGRVELDLRMPIPNPNQLPPLDVPLAMEFVERNICPLYERAISAARKEMPSDVAMAEEPSILRAVAYFATRCLARVLGVPDPASVLSPGDAREVRTVLADLLKKAVTLCAGGLEYANRQMVADLAAFQVPRGLLGRRRERSALIEVAEGAGMLADCLKSIYRGRAEDGRQRAVDSALHALKAVVLERGIPFESSDDAKSLHAEQLRDLEALARVVAGSRFDLWETGPFGPLWEAEAPALLAEGEVAWQAEIMAELTPPMPAKSSVLVSAEFSHAPSDVYAELRMPDVRGQRAEKSELEATVQKRLTESVLADLRALGASGLRLQEQMIAPIQERLDALAGKSFGSYEANQRVVDELNAIIEAFGIRLLYAGPKKVYRDRVVVLRMYDRSDAAAGQFFVRLAEAGAKKISAENEFPMLKAATARSSNDPA